MEASTTGDLASAGNVTTVERSGPEVTVSRWFDAPVDIVFEAWSKPELFRRWWVPRSMGMTLTACEMDVRTGGQYRLGFEGMDFFGRYVEVTPPTRIVWTNDEGETEGSVTTVTLTETDGKTLVVVHERYTSEEALAAEGGAEEALPEVFAQLDDLLVELTAEA
jgi:uncharacterized protein YndB with AHSA1/START domain